MPLPISLKSQIARRQKLQPDTIGICTVCGIDLVRIDGTPEPWPRMLPCNLADCPFESALVQLARLREPPFSLLPSSAWFAMEMGRGRRWRRWACVILV